MQNNEVNGIRYCRDIYDGNGRDEGTSETVASVARQERRTVGDK